MAVKRVRVTFRRLWRKIEKQIAAQESRRQFLLRVPEF